MVAKKARIRVKLLGRGKLSHESFEADVRRFQEQSQFGFPSAEIVSRAGKSNIFQTINLKNYYILEIESWLPDRSSTYSEPYLPTESDQKEALQALAESWRGKEWEDNALNEKEPKVVGTGDPKRLEIAIETHGMTAKRLLVTYIIPPKDHFRGFTVAGRLWNGSQWDKKLTHYYSLSTKIHKIEAYLRRGTGSTSEFFKPQQQKQAWQSLHNFLTKFTTAELALLKEWQPNSTTSNAYEDDSADDWPYCGVTGQVGSGSYWSQQAPHHYHRPKKIKPAYFRVAGDEIGASLYKDRVERQRNTQAKVEAGEKVEKKCAAGAEEPALQTSAPAASEPGDNPCCGSSGSNSSSHSSSGNVSRFRLYPGVSRKRALIVDGKVIAKGSDSIH